MNSQFNLWVYLLIISDEQLPMLEWNLYHVIHKYLSLHADVTISRDPYTCLHGYTVIILVDTLQDLIRIYRLMTNKLHFPGDYFYLPLEIRIP